MAVNGIALATVATGAVFIYAGVTGKSVLKSVQTIVSGQTPSTLPNVNPITPQASATAASSGTATGSPASTSPSSAGGSVSQYQAYAFSLFPNYGWGTDQQQYLIELWNQESGWNPNAVNSSSGAAGIPQDITGNMHGGWQGQIQWGLTYIQGRYGNPQMAWAHEVANNWY